VVAFIDYKIDNDRCDTSINQCLISMGAKVEKTFNRKVNITYDKLLILKQFFLICLNFFFRLRM